MQPAPQPFRPDNTSHSTRLTLREQQVMQLRREMIHPGGVRIQLRRKDCIGSIALVDAFGGVWVGGWKQKEHPMLYNALHIGDQLVSIGGISISSSSEANRVIRNAPGLYVSVPEAADGIRACCRESVFANFHDYRLWMKCYLTVCL